MKKTMAVLIALNIYAGYCVAQIYIEPVIGYQIDLNNQSMFKQINSALQFSLKKSSYYELILQVQKTWPVQFVSNDSSFSSNPALPVYASAKKTIRPGSWAFAIGHRISLLGVNSNNIFSFIFYSGISYQQIKVNYQYDKSNYIILNPNQTQNRTGLFLSGGMEYMRLFKNGRFFIQLNAATPPAGKKINYPSSFGLMAPLSFNTGYSIPIKKNKHEKK